MTTREVPCDLCPNTTQGVLDDESGVIVSTTERGWWVEDGWLCPSCREQQHQVDLDVDRLRELSLPGEASPGVA